MDVVIPPPGGTQFLPCRYDMQELHYNICGGLGTTTHVVWAGSATRSQHGIRNDSWLSVVSGDGFVSIIDPCLAPPHRVLGKVPGKAS
jgi:hypothetical protein